MTKLCTILATAAAAAATLACSAAQAGILTGQTLGGSGLGLQQSAAIVGNNIEFSVGDAAIFNFDGDGLLTFSNFTFSHTVIFDPRYTYTYTFTDLNGTLPDFTGLTLVGTGGTVTGFAASDLTFTADSFTIDFGNTTWSRDAWAQIQIGFASPSPVPAPPTLALLGLGLFAAAAARRPRAARRFWR